MASVHSEREFSTFTYRSSKSTYLKVGVVDDVMHVRRRRRPLVDHVTATLRRNLNALRQFPFKRRTELGKRLLYGNQRTAIKYTQRNTRMIMISNPLINLSHILNYKTSSCVSHIQKFSDLCDTHQPIYKHRQVTSRAHD